MSRPRIAVALGSGGLRGMAHIGVLRALEEAEIRPTLYAGSSAGALVAAAAAHGFALPDLESVADRLQRSSIFQIDYVSLLRYGLRTLRCTAASGCSLYVMSCSATSRFAISRLH